MRADEQLQPDAQAEILRQRVDRKAPREVAPARGDRGREPVLVVNRYSPDKGAAEVAIFCRVH